VMPRSQTAAKARSSRAHGVGAAYNRCTTVPPQAPAHAHRGRANVAADCHEARLEKWRLDDFEAERREVMWEAWNLAASRGLR